MQADCSVELGAEDERLELPWASPHGRLRYYDLKRRPDLLLNIEEAHRHPELGEFLSAINSSPSLLETAKCDTWTSGEISPEEEVYGAARKFGSYIDLVFSEEHLRYSFDCHDHFVHRLVRLLHKAPEISAAAEFTIRRCRYHLPQTEPAPAAQESSPAGEPRDGFYFTFYLFGYGDDDEEARRRWAIALKLVENALLQLSVRHRRGADQTAPELGGT